MAAQTNVLSEVLREAGGWAGRVRALLRQHFPPLPALPWSFGAPWVDSPGLGSVELNSTDLKGQWEATYGSPRLGTGHEPPGAAFWCQGFSGALFLSNSLSHCNRGKGLVDQKANQCSLLFPVGVKTGWLHRVGQEARGRSQRCLGLLIFVFFEGGDKEAGAVAAEWAAWLVMNSDLPSLAFVCSQEFRRESKPLTFLFLAAF